RPNHGDIESQRNHFLFLRVSLPVWQMFGLRNWRHDRKYSLRSPRKTLTEGQEQFEQTLEADLSAQQRPDDVCLAGEEFQPGIAVGRHAEVGISDVSVEYLEGLVANHDCRLPRFGSCKREMEGCI